MIRRSRTRGRLLDRPSEAKPNKEEESENSVYQGTVPQGKGAKPGTVIPPGKGVRNKKTCLI